MYDYLFYKFYARGRSQEYVLDKNKSIAAYKGYMINRLQKMFHYENLPETIPQYMLEYYLMVNGSCLVAEYNGKPYAFLGSFGGEPDPYYRPTKYVVANPALKMNETYDLWDTKGEESSKCVLMRNDVMWMGLNPLMSRYATLLAENVITLRTADIMLRVVAMITSPDDKTKIAAQAYLRDLEEGKIGVIGENRFFEGIKLQSPPSNNGSYLTQFIELQQYYKGSFFNEIGLSASFNMKREAIGEGEATLNEDTLAPLIDTMLQCRQEDVSRLNDLFDLSITVEFDSAWRQNIKEAELNLQILESESDSDVEYGDNVATGNSNETEFEGVDSDIDGDGGDGGTGDGDTIQSNEGDLENSSGDDQDVGEDAGDSRESVSQLTQVEIHITNGTNTSEESDLISVENGTDDNEGSDLISEKEGEQDEDDSKES